VRLITRNGHDWSGRFPLIAEAAGSLRARSFVIDRKADGRLSFDIVECSGSAPLRRRKRRRPGLAGARKGH